MNTLHPAEPGFVLALSIPGANTTQFLLVTHWRQHEDGKLEPLTHPALPPGGHRKTLIVPDSRKGEQERLHGWQRPCSFQDPELDTVDMVDRFQGLFRVQTLSEYLDFQLEVLNGIGWVDHRKFFEGAS